MPRFNRKAARVTAVQWKGENFDEVSLITARVVAGSLMDRLRDKPHAYLELDFYRHLVIRSIGGSKQVGVGDWVIKDDMEGLYSCTHDAFTQAYEPTED